MFLRGLAEEGIVWKCREGFLQGDIQRQIADDGFFIAVRAQFPFDAAGMLAQAHHPTAHDALKPAVSGPRPAEGLAAFQRAGEGEIRNVD